MGLAAKGAGWTACTALCRLWMLCFASVLFLSACGGGGSSDSTSGQNIFISAGSDRNATEGATVALTAEVSTTSTTLTYRWTASPAITITHEDTSVADASFTAPTVTENTPYTFTVTVTDENGHTATDTVVITIVSDNIAPVAAITLTAWPDLATGTYPAGVAITLDGRNSSDADASNSTLPISSWRWEQTQGTDVVTNVALNQSTLSFTTPIASTSQILAFSLTVADEEGATDTTSVTLTIQSDDETVPTVDAGVNHAVFSGEPIILEGEASTSIPAANPLSYQWRHDNTQTITIQNSSALSTYAVAPSVIEKSNIIFTLTVTDANGNVKEDSITVAVRPQPTPLLNDTGVLSQATDTSITTAQQNTYPGQDGQRGQDIIDANGQVQKAGRGLAGFDFTKLNSNGDEEDNTASDWSCVRDNVTGLVWEVKTDDSSYHDKDYRYSWYASADNGGFVGYLNGSGTVCNITNCSTENYVTAINSVGLCGFYDWRIPTHAELLSLVHFGLSTTAKIDTNYFPYTGDISEGTLWYWASQASADGVEESGAAQNAWAVDYVSGVDNFLNKETAARIRLVRAGR